MAELLLDFFSFGGMFAKDGGMPEFLKTSARGWDFCRTAFGVNIIRQLVQQLLIFVIVAVVTGIVAGNIITGSDYMMGLTIALAGFAITVIKLTLTRFSSQLFLNYIASIIGELVFVLVVAAVYMHLYISFGVVIVLAIAGSIFSIKVTMKKYEEGFYDKAD